MTTPDNPLTWTVRCDENFTLAHFVVAHAGGLLSESDLSRIELPAAAKGREALGLVLSGRGPVWLYAYLTHLAHPYAWLGIFDPRLADAVVVSRHRPDAPAVGAVIAVGLPPEPSA